MIQRVLNSKNFLAMLLAMVTGTLLYFKIALADDRSACPARHGMNISFG